MGRFKKVLFMLVLGLLVASSVTAQTKVYEKPDLPPTESTNGLKLYDIVVGSDAHNGIEVTEDSPITITIMISGKENEKWDKFNTEVTVYAMPCDDLMVRDKYLIYQGMVLYLHGHSEVTFLWNGKNKEGKFLPAGKYKIYSLAKVFDGRGNLMAKASRFWRQDYIFETSVDIVILAISPTQVQGEKFE
jgi:flagellar hook assembly protein FlgD